jgi:uncharacterized protein (DUF433 family)
MSNEIIKIEGIYTAIDASRILRVPYNKAKYWFQYYAKHKLFETIGHRYNHPIKDVISINFLTLIEMYMFFLLKENDIKTKDIINAHTRMSEFYNTPYPFAFKDIYTSGKEILFNDKGQLRLGKDVQQLLIQEYIEPFSKKIRFSNRNIAHKFYPLGIEKNVVVDPNHQVGQPIIDNTNILTDTIFDYYNANESKESISELFNISIEQINDVIEFHQAA